MDRDYKIVAVNRGCTMLEKSVDRRLCDAVLLRDLRMANDKAPIKEVEVR